MADLALDESSLPFAGELIEVDADARRMGRRGRTRAAPVRPVTPGPRRRTTRRSPGGSTAGTSAPASCTTGCRIGWRRRRAPERDLQFPLLLDLLNVQPESRMPTGCVPNSYAEPLISASTRPTTSVRRPRPSPGRARSSTATVTRRMTAPPSTIDATSCSGGAMNARSTPSSGTPATSATSADRCPTQLPNWTGEVAAAYSDRQEPRCPGLEV